MEVGLSIRFLESTILFSLTPNYEKNLKTELWLCHENMGVSMTELNNMSVLDRKNYIVLHNRHIEKQKEAFESKKKHH